LEEDCPVEDSQEGQPQDEEQQRDEAVQRDEAEQQRDEAGPIYAELEPRAPLPPVPARRPRGQLPTRSSGRFSGQGGPLASLPYSGRRI
jgi:hypothetical protein